jgi:hypothetical protein
MNASCAKVVQNIKQKSCGLYKILHFNEKVYNIAFISTSIIGQKASDNFK